MHKILRLTQLTRSRNLFIRIKNTDGDKTVFFDDLEEIASEADDTVRNIVNEAIDLVTSSFGDDAEEATECVIEDLDAEITTLQIELLDNDSVPAIEVEEKKAPQEEISQTLSIFDNHPLYARDGEKFSSVAPYWFLWIFQVYLEASKNPMAQNNIDNIGVSLWGETQVRSKKLRTDAGSSIDIDTTGRITGFFGKGYIDKPKFLHQLLFTHTDVRLKDLVEKICRIGLKPDLEQTLLSPYLMRMFRITSDKSSPEFRFSTQFISSATKTVNFGRRAMATMDNEANQGGYQNLDNASRKYYEGMWIGLRKSEYLAGTISKPEPLLKGWGSMSKQEAAEASQKPPLAPTSASEGQEYFTKENASRNTLRKAYFPSGNEVEAGEVEVKFSTTNSKPTLRLEPKNKSEGTTMSNVNVIFAGETQAHRAVYFALNMMTKMGKPLSQQSVSEFALVERHEVTQILTDLSNARLVMMHGEMISAVQPVEFTSL